MSESGSVRQTASLRDTSRPVLVVVVDTEEEFDWGAPFDRSATQVTAMDEIGRFQEACDEFDVRPTYVVDYPVASQERGSAPLREFRKRGRAEIGAHLHPWVNPPFEEEVVPRNSYPGNLPRPLERAKLSTLTDAIEESFGFRPTVYRAGRYGVGPNTIDLLEELGFEIDTSYCPAFDFRSDGGPDYSSHAATPFWFGSPGRSILEIPNTGAFVGFLNGLSAPVHRLATRPFFERLHVPGILARLRAVDRLMLSPEGHTLDELRRLTEWVRRKGIGVVTFSLHSSSLKPGCTPYVQTAADRQAFLDVCRRYFDFLLNTLGGIAMTPSELRHALSPETRQHAS